MAPLYDPEPEPVVRARDNLPTRFEDRQRSHRLCAASRVRRRPHIRIRYERRCMAARHGARPVQATRLKKPNREQDNGGGEADRC